MIEFNKDLEANGKKNDAERYRECLTEMFRRQCLTMTEFDAVTCQVTHVKNSWAFVANTFKDRWGDWLDKTVTNAYVCQPDNKGSRRWYCLNPFKDAEYVGDDDDMLATLRNEQKKKAAVFRITEPARKLQFWKCPGVGNELVPGGAVPCGRIYPMSVSSCWHCQKGHRRVTYRPWFRVTNTASDIDRRRR